MTTPRRSSPSLRSSEERRGDPGMSVSTAPLSATLPLQRKGRPSWYWPVLLVGSLLVVATVRVITGANDIISSGALGAALGLAVPLALAGLGGLWSERAGVVNIGLEGMMILGTWGAGFFGFHYGPWIGILGAAAMGLLGGAVHALATVIFGVDHIVSGVAINLLGAGAGAYLAVRTFSDLPGGGPTQSPPLERLPNLSLPWVGEPLAALERTGTWLVADLAGILHAVTTNVNSLTLIAAGLLVLTWWVLWRTPFGLRVRSVGEAPHAAETLGVNVLRLKFTAVLFSGALAGIAGGFLVLVASNIYRDGQTGGRGYIGLAAMIFGNWRPGGLAAGAMLFGYTDAIRLRGGGDVIRAFLLPLGLLLLAWGIYQLVRRGKRIAGLVQIVVAVLALVWFALIDAVPNEFTGMTPYLATLLVLALASQRLRMPAADGAIYRKGEAS
ncbi:MAG: ABC transporter permease [Propionicimonas sp.]